jgi:hypothetical protein
MPSSARFCLCLCLFAILIAATVTVRAAKPQSTPRATSTSDTSLARLVSIMRGKAKALEASTGMRLGFQSFTSEYKIPPQSISNSDYTIAHLFYEATRDAGFWNMHWSITDQPPNSDRIWSQWKSVKTPSPLTPTAIAECDELSALYAFLVERAGVKTVGLFWPAANHTVAVWVLHPTSGPVVRVVVPTSQIFLDDSDDFGTRKFDPWRQKTIYEYTRRDAPDSFELPQPLFDFFLQQVDKYGGASDATLQRLRYLREAVFLKAWRPEDAAREALRSRTPSSPAEDAAAFQNFAQDMRSKAQQ